MNLEHMFVSFQDFVGKTGNFSVQSLTRFSREDSGIFVDGRNKER